MRPLFNQCKPCGTDWPTRDLFIHDRGVEIVEYRVNFDDITAGVFVFRHACGATLSMPVRDFNGLYHGPIFNQRATGTDECPGYCLYKDELRECMVKCECAYVRNIIGIIKSTKATICSIPK